MHYGQAIVERRDVARYPSPNAASKTVAEYPVNRW
jgi:hypothetical protein